jgi:hypothetical protein
MTPEQLMQPRYKVIADYPKSIHPVGTIIDAGWQSEDLLYCDWDGPRCRDFPHLFKKLEWWEEREEKDMPEYVKINADECSFIRGTVLKVDGVGRYPDRIKPLGNEGDLYVTLTIPEDTETHDAGEQVTMNVKNVLPAALSEYEQLNKAK